MTWQPIRTAPKDGTLVVLWCAFDDASEPVIARWKSRRKMTRGPFGRFTWCELNRGAVAEKVPTHWMLLPEPPEVSK